MTLQDLMRVRPMWFTEGNRKFFNDVDYWVEYSASGKPYLARSTYGWSDMFGGPKRLHFRLNLIKENFDVGPLIDQVFNSINDIEDWLTEN
jgi:hypothetical protein